MAKAKAKAKAKLATAEEATAEATALWDRYHSAREKAAPAPLWEELRTAVRGAIGRARRRSAEPGFKTIEQRLTDLRTYVERFRPREAGTAANPEDVLRDVEELCRAQAASAGAGADEKKALAARAVAIERRIEDARARSPDEDEDHDPYVGAEEQLWDIQQRLKSSR